jgi:hypothetical protein
MGHPVPPSQTCDEPAALAVLDSDLGFMTGTNLTLLREFFFEKGALDRRGAVYIAGDHRAQRNLTFTPVHETAQPRLGQFLRRESMIVLWR